MNSLVNGYAEGYYGRLLSWAERHQILDVLQRLGFNTYYYAPKEDTCHRLHWRTPYSHRWHADFSRFCTYACERDIRVVAGVAPGLDFDFAHLPDGQDFESLITKCQALLDDGARDISLLMDDIDADFAVRSGSFDEEGRAHAGLANALGDALGSALENALWVTPRIYADELIVEAPSYLPGFMQTLESRHRILYCGRDVVAKDINTDSLVTLRSALGDSDAIEALNDRVIIWDNLYANDYCPRRFFIGPWTSRNPLQQFLLNPTGMVQTDCLLLELMATGMSSGCAGEPDEDELPVAWKNVLRSHGVPEEFLLLAPFFYHPTFNADDSPDNVTQGGAVQHSAYCEDNKAIRAAIEHCLWRWKTPLAREWYPAIFGLKHDLLTLANEHLPLRIRKTQNSPLARLLLGNSTE